MFPKPEDHDATVDKRRDVLESDYENERRNSKPNSESKRSDTYHDVMHDNEYLDWGCNYSSSNFILLMTIGKNDNF